MKVVFRVDASYQMGTGHMMRCLTLAEGLRNRGCIDIQFITRNLDGNLISLVQERAFPLSILPKPDHEATLKNHDIYASWLAVSQDQDAIDTISVLNDQKPDWLIIDHYGIDAQWEGLLREYSCKIMVIDDLANRSHDCNLLLDQNFSMQSGERYLGLVHKSCDLLLGPRYALLRPEYASYRETLRKRSGELKQILIFFGGTDKDNLTGKVLDVLSDSSLRHLQVNIVLGANNTNYESLKSQAAERGLTNLYKSLPHLADLMANADICFGAGGATTWERFCLKLPTILISIAENQEPAANELSKAGLVIYLGRHLEISREKILGAILMLSNNLEKMYTLSNEDIFQVDGMGVLRVAEKIAPSNLEEILLIPIHSKILPADLEVCDSKESTVSYLTDRILENDIRNFIQRMNAKDYHLFSLALNGLNVGYLGLIKQSDGLIIDYWLDDIIINFECLKKAIDKLDNLVKKIYLADFSSVQTNTIKASYASVFLSLISEKTKTYKHLNSFSISILSDQLSWMNDYISDLRFDWLKTGHRVQWVHDKRYLKPADFCFYLSCGEIVSPEILGMFKHNLVVHESDLPRGKGWSPLTWQILEGENKIAVTLFEASEKVDAGEIYAQEWLEFEGDELLDELRFSQASGTIRLCKLFIENYPEITKFAKKQSGDESFYPKRKTADSQLDVNLAIKDQFNLLRIVDNQRYPLFFKYLGNTYFLEIKKRALDQ